MVDVVVSDQACLCVVHTVNAVVPSLRVCVAWGLGLGNSNQMFKPEIEQIEKWVI